VPRFKNPLAVIFLTVFIDLVGFGILIPILPTYAERFGAGGTEVGFLQAIFSLMQFLFAPVWGRVSDRVGRKPVIVATAVGTSIAYVVFGLADALWLLFVSRAIAGVCGGNIATAQAYIADVTPPEERSRGMAIIGAAFGLGFTLGPGLAALSQRLGPQAPFFIAAALAALNAVWAAVAISEPERHRPRVRRSVGSYLDALRLPRLAFYIGLLLLTTYAFSNVEVSFALFTHHELGFGEHENALAFVYIGAMISTVQMGVVRPLARRVSSTKLMIAGTLCMSVGAAILPLAGAWWHLAPALTLLAAGNALYAPSVMGSISTSAPEDRQGEMLGVAQSAGAIGRIAGPAGGGALFQHAGHPWPFWVAGALLGAACLAVIAQRVPGAHTSAR
jgi:DHA1 family tetracycline resistance protein-like MFS transporter